MKPPRQRHVQAVGQEGDEDVRLDPRLELVEEGPDGEIAFQRLKG